MAKKYDDENQQRMMERRQQVLDDLTDDRVNEIASRAWNKAKSMHCTMKNAPPGKGGMVDWSKVAFRDKQKCVADFLLGVTESYEFQRSFVKEAIADPLAVMKMAISMMPKEVEVSTSTQIGIVVLPGKAGSVGEWMDMAKGHKDIDGEVLGDTGKTAAETWKNILGSTGTEGQE